MNYDKIIDATEKKAEKPTERQVKYAEYLAKRMCQKLPDEKTKQTYSDFIARWKPVVQQEDKNMNEPSSWQMQYI